MSTMQEREAFIPGDDPLDELTQVKNTMATVERLAGPDILTEKDRLVCRYFIGPGMYTKAKTARLMKADGVVGGLAQIDRTLKKQESQNFIDYLQHQLVSQANVTPEELVKRASYVVRASVSDLFKIMPDGRVLLRDLQEIPEELKYAIKKIKFFRKANGKGVDRVYEEAVEIELESRAPFMVMLAQWLGMEERAKDMNVVKKTITGLVLKLKGKTDE